MINKYDKEIANAEESGRSYPSPRLARVRATFADLVQLSIELLAIPSEIVKKQTKTKQTKQQTKKQQYTDFENWSIVSITCISVN